MRIAMTLAILVGTLLGVVVYGCAEKPKHSAAYRVTLFDGSGQVVERWLTWAVDGDGTGYYFKDFGSGGWVRVSGTVVVDEVGVGQTPGVRQ